MLLQRGSVGDDLWQRFLRAEKEMEEEVKDVVAEVSLLLYFLAKGPVLYRDQSSQVPLNIGKCIRPELGPNHFPVRK